MKNILILFVLIFISLCVVGPVYCYPGAFGFAKNTIGGSGGQIIHVTNLKNSGTGSLRAAISAEGSRVIVFDVAGAINLLSEISITNPYVTIAGQSAPESGITILNAAIRIKTHDVVMQHIRFRVGDKLTAIPFDNRDCAGIENNTEGTLDTYNIWVDHCSFSFAIDEIFELWYDGVRSITISNCIFAYGLKNSYHSAGAHSMGLLVGDHAKNISIIKNIFAHNNDRNPGLFGDTSVYVANNLIYNCSQNCLKVTDSNGSGLVHVDIVGNVFKKGPDSVDTKPIWLDDTLPISSSIFMDDNIQVNPEVIDQSSLTRLPIGGGVMLKTSGNVSCGYTPISSAAVIDHVLRNCGAWSGYRDNVDTSIIESISNGTGSVIDTPSDIIGCFRDQYNYFEFQAPSEVSMDSFLKIKSDHACGFSNPVFNGVVIIK